MAPVKKQKSNKPSKVNKQEKKEENSGEPVVSGQLQKKINKKLKRKPKDLRGVVFLKNLPHGFFEEQLKKYFEQFGNVTRVRLARSRRTGNSKGYAFVEFEYPEVAEVAAETMDNYLMFKRIVKASYIPPEKQQFNYFRTSVKQVRNRSGKLVWVSAKTASILKKVNKHNDWNEENFQKRTQKQMKKIQKLADKYAHLGININELVVQPNILIDKKEMGKPKATSENKINTLSGEQKSTLEASSNKRNKTSKSKVSLKDLLGNTIQEDTEDEDYIVMSESEEDGGESSESSNEETYGFVKGSDCEDIEDDDDNDSEEETKHILRKKSKNTFKVSNVERMDEILKRKSHAGGISKISKKPLKLSSAGNKEKTSLKIMAAKELAKPLSKVKAKLNKPVKPKKSLKLK